MNYNSITVLRMREYAESVLSNLASTDPRVSGSVKVTHPGGSTSVVGCAFAESVGDWCFVFSLIDGFVLFGKDQVAHSEQQSAFRPTRLACDPVARTDQRTVSNRTMAA